ncbi:MAG: hypothetical protein Q9227_007141 [Pyrenula ochraceoflavens]
MLFPDLSLKAALTCAKDVLPSTSINKFFNTPMPVSSLYTGREEKLENLNLSLLDVKPAAELSAQRRFWGVFHIDASSIEHAERSFAVISGFGKVAANEASAKAWLSSQSQPWLLIIDNADGVGVPIEKYFPEGGNGLIFVTTRNPTLRVHGTFGPNQGHYDFTGLEESDSNDLLLKAAGTKNPWTSSMKRSAAKICRTLGYLPLALVHAGKAILSGRCTLQNYLKTFNANLERVRKMGKSRKAMRNSPESDMIVYSSFDTVMEGLTQKGGTAAEDAMDLLKTFAFFDRHNIRFDILERAVRNPKRESAEREKTAEEERKLEHKLYHGSWSRRIKNFRWKYTLYAKAYLHQPPLPEALQDDGTPEGFDESRVRDALILLHQLSLISWDQENDTWSMHSIVHFWARERAEMGLDEQELWSAIAANILSRSILLPPLGDQEGEDTFRRDVAPHIAFITDFRRDLRSKILNNETSWFFSWSSLNPRINLTRSFRHIKFAYVSAQSGRWQEAEELLTPVARNASEKLGMEHPVTIDVTLFLASMYRHLDQDNKSADLQQKLLDASIERRGDNDLKSLKIRESLGLSRFQQSKYSEALALQQTAFDQLCAIHGRDHPKALGVMVQLGRVTRKFHDFKKSIRLHDEALAGLCKDQCPCHEQTCRGPSHLETIEARGHLAMAYFDRAYHSRDSQPRDVERAVELAEEAAEQRKDKLGDEHPLSLLAQCNLARMRAWRGRHEEAASQAIPIIRLGCAIAERDIGATHIGTLYGRLQLSEILILAKHYQEAERILLHVLDSHEKHRSLHFDRLYVLFHLIRCYNLQGRGDESYVFRQKLSEGIRTIYASHPTALENWEAFFFDPQNLSDPWMRLQVSQPSLPNEPLTTAPRREATWH